MAQPTQPLDELRDTLLPLPPRLIEGDFAGVVRELLAQAWTDLDGHDAESMEGHKVNRAEDLQWEPPNLAFRIVRHGGTVMGSSRGTIQKWTVNVEQGTARHQNVGHQQLRDMHRPLDVKVLADDLVALITSGTKDERLKWSSPDKVRVNIGNVIPDDGPKQTLQNRRKRLRAELVKKLKADGWTESQTWTFERSPVDG